MAKQEYEQELWHRLLNRDGSVVLVVGAGCSVEQTRLPPAPELSRTAHDFLLNASHLPEECDNPSDLEALAKAVPDRIHLIRCLRDLLSDAPPNDGHKIAAALMLEGVVASILTTNFDLALSGALTLLGAFPKVREIQGRDDEMAQSNLIYLHGTIHSQPDEWVLTSEEVEAEWEDHWRGVLTASVLTSPIVVFAGVGAAVGVLVSSLKKIHDALSDNQVVLLVEPGPLEDSEFFQESGLSPDSHISDGWIDFAESLGVRLQKQICSELMQTAETLLEENSPPWPDIDAVSSGSAYEDLGLVRAGMCRANWLGEEVRYQPWGDNDNDHRRLAYLLLAVARIADHTGTTPWFTERGVAHFDNPDNNATTHSVLMVHGGGTLAWTTLISREAQILRRINVERYQPTVVIGGGLTGTRPSEIAAHKVTGDVDPTSIVDGADNITYHSVGEIMEDPGRVAS